MRFALVRVHRAETLGLAGIGVGLLLFLMGYVAGLQSQASALAEGGAGYCPSAAVGDFEPVPSDGSERKVRTTIIRDQPR